MEAERPPDGAGFKPFGDDGLTFADVIDIVNPLQHVPILSSFYRKLTGDTIDPAIRIAGGALFGGPLGAIASTMAVAVNEARRAPVDEAPAGDAQLAEPASPNKPPLAAYAGDQIPGRRREPTDTSARERAPEVVAVPQPRRGGWMVAQAYGETLNRFAELAPGASRDTIDETV